VWERLYVKLQARQWAAGFDHHVHVRVEVVADKTLVICARVDGGESVTNTGYGRKRKMQTEDHGIQLPSTFQKVLDISANEET
jgi:hypothetical protein